MIRHNCPQCRHELKTSDHLAGLTIVCPECRERIPVPDGAPPRGAITAAPPAAPPAGGEYAPGPEPLPLLGPRPRDPLQPSEPLPEALRWPPPARRLPASAYALLIGIGAVVFAAGCALAWLLAGGTAWTVISIGGGILAFLPALSLLWGWVKSGFAADAGRTLAGWLPFILYGAALWAAWFVIGTTYAWGMVYVDNFSPRDVRLDVDGEEWATSRARTTDTRGLRRGKYTLTVRALDTGEELDRLNVEVSGSGNYVLNVLGAQVYARGTAQYGGFHFFGPPPEEAVKLPWFKADVDYLFEEPPASITVSVRRGETATGATKTYLLRRPPLPPQKQFGPGLGLPRR
jgi:hypothetical protein